jgi:hypothetical protein
MELGAIHDFDDLIISKGSLKGRALVSLNTDELKLLAKRQIANAPDGAIIRAYAVAKLGLAELHAKGHLVGRAPQPAAIPLANDAPDDSGR